MLFILPLCQHLHIFVNECTQFKSRNNTLSFAKSSCLQKGQNKHQVACRV